MIQCSPELTGDGGLDYTVYALDYSEPDTPLVGQGMLSGALAHYGVESLGGQPQLVTGRVTRNLLAVFGNGTAETLEVKLKLTAVPRITRSTTVPLSQPMPSTRPTRTLVRSDSNLSENTEWSSFVQSNPGLGQRTGTPTSNLATVAPAQAQSYAGSFEAKSDAPPQRHRLLQPAPSSRPPSVGPPSVEPSGPSSTQGPQIASARQSPAVEESAPTQKSGKATKPRSRPASRASTRAPTGRPRGRPRKKPIGEGNTSGYEDGTDGDDGPSRSKKRATVTKVERSNVATFGTAPESLRVAASTSGSIRNFRPIAAAGDSSVGSHLQEGPRAPTPVPEHRFSGPAPGHQARPVPSRGLSRLSMASGVSPSTQLEFNHSMSQSQDGRFPMDSTAPSPSSDGPSPADIGSSPPVPRSAMYSVRSSPAPPSSPILPPMRPPLSQPDSGFMSGGVDESRDENGNAGKHSAAAKPKRPRVRAKKPLPKPLPKPSSELIIQTETPGPEELLPRTSIYNPVGLRKREASETAAPTTISVPEPDVRAQPQTLAEPGPGGEWDLANQPRCEQFDDTGASNVSGTVRPLTLPAPSQAAETQREESPAEKADAQTPQDYEPIQGNYTDLEMALMSAFPDDESQGDPSPGSASQPATQDVSNGITDKANIRTMEPPATTPAQETAEEPELPPAPASDPVFPQLTLPAPPSEPPHPQTDAVDALEALEAARANKNYVKRQTIRQKLEEAVAAGQLPSFCCNCGALQTPTWRKIWKQQHKGVPTYHEYSEKPGCVTAINILERDEDRKPTSYELIKKTLGPTDDKSMWTEVLLCNPCGIWFSKWKSHRPKDKWEKDEARLGQTRKKRANGSGPTRSKRARTKSDAQTNLTSDFCPPTDAVDQVDDAQLHQGPVQQSNTEQQAYEAPKMGSGKGRTRAAPMEPIDQGSTHSRGSSRSKGTGTPDSPIMLEEELGATRRLLFPSPRKEGEQKVLGHVAINLVRTPPGPMEPKEGGGGGKENSSSVARGYNAANDDFADLFGTPPRPSTPPPKAPNGGVFKTPTRPTPSHRPITRSVSKSMRSVRSVTSPSQLLERTPSRTPRSSLRQRGERQLLPSQMLDEHGSTMPMTRSIYELLSEADNFVMPTSSPGRVGGYNYHNHLDLDAALSDLGMGGEQHHFDFGNLLSTDGVMMPSSPPSLHNMNGHFVSSFPGIAAYGDEADDGSAGLWAALGETDRGFVAARARDAARLGQTARDNEPPPIGLTTTTPNFENSLGIGGAP
ncbi:hypothetical protein GGR56DRAFT_107988 [Xylariaceae sp. FL0804]|nr:hypothetical protein GGR56DRAFT_107988 [Xylariaceae sp. FL0804]